MIISDEIKKAHLSLSKTGLKFLEFIEKNPWCLKHSQYQGLQWPYRKVVLQPWPLFINQHFKKEAMDAGIKVLNLIKQIPRRIFDFDPQRMGSYYEAPKEAIKEIMTGVTEDHIRHLLGRGDFVHSHTQGFKCLEYNIAGNLGGWELPFWSTLYMRTPPMMKFLAENPLQLINEDLVAIALRSYINRMLRQYPLYRTEMNAVMIMLGHQNGTTNSPYENHILSMYRNLLHSIDKDLKGELIVCDYPHLQVRENNIYYQGKRVLCLHENYGGIVPDEIWQVFCRGNLLLYVGPLTMLVSNKLNIALLSEHEESDLFTPEERESIKKYIPWSRKTVPGQTRFQGETVDLETFVLANKEKLVLKPALNLGGKQILIGLHTSQPEWEQEINKAFRKRAWLVQEYIEPTAYLFQEGEEGCAAHNIVWGIFVFGGTYAGSFLRTLSTKSNKGVINAHQGADISVVFEVRE